MIEIVKAKNYAHNAHGFFFFIDFIAFFQGKESHPGGAPGLQNRWDALDGSGGFDSHSFPPFLLHLGSFVAAYFSAQCTITTANIF